MGFVELFLVGVSLSMDAFAAAVCKGLGMSRLNMRQALAVGLFFGGFQALMPLIGWLLGTQFAQFVEPVDHWIAFALLAFIGAKMLWDAFHPEEDGETHEAADAPLDCKGLLLLAVATSIDALAMGISFAFLGVGIWAAIAIIGVTTFAISVAGVAIGHQFGKRFEKGATVAGGIVLILIGLRILSEHLGILVL